MIEALVPEDQLCLLIARKTFSPEVAERVVDILKDGLRWEVLVERAAAHGLIPILYKRLHQLDFPGVPSSTRRKLTDTFGVNAIRNELFVQELSSLLTQLGAMGIPAIPLKGVFLAESLYGDSALRICADLDILIPAEQLALTVQRLQLSGYQSPCSHPSHIALLARYGKDFALMRQDARQAYPLQVHCGLIWGGPAEHCLLAELWREAIPQTYRTAQAYAMSPEWEFLYLAVHAARHGWYPFKWMVDLDWLIARGALDWGVVQEKARQLGWERIVQSCFAACVTLLGTPIPKLLAENVRVVPPRIPTSGPTPLEIPRETIFAVQLLPNLPARLQFIAARLFVPTPADCEFLHLPSSMFFLYYLLRPWRLAIAVAGWLFQAGMPKLRRMIRRAPTPGAHASLT